MDSRRLSLSVQLAVYRGTIAHLERLAAEAEAELAALNAGSPVASVPKTEASDA